MSADLHAPPRVGGPVVLRPPRGRQGGDGDAPRRCRPGAGWFPIGGELTVGRARPQGGHLLRRRAGPDDPRVVAGLPLHGPNLFPERRPATARRGARVHRRHDRARATACCGASRSASASTRRGSTQHLTADPIDAVPHLPLPAATPTRPSRTGAWPSTPTTACSRSCARTTPAACEVRRRRTAGSTSPPMPDTFVVQPRRHARPDDRRPLPLDAAPGAHPADASACRSRSSSTRPGMRRSCRYR